MEFSRQTQYSMGISHGQQFLVGKCHSWHLLIQRQQWKLQSNAWNLFKVKNKDTGTAPLTSTNYANSSDVSIAHFEQVNAD